MFMVYMFMQMFGGLGLLLYGMKLLGDGLELAAGSKMRTLVGKFTKNKYIGAIVGLLITAVIQSSSATTVMTVGLVNAGIMTLSQATGVIMGANIGTTVTGLIIALKIEMIAPVAIFCGVTLMLFVKNKFYKSLGQIVTGLGILFLGINIMSESMKPLSQLPQFTNLLAVVSNPLLGILVGAIFTAIIQSSSVSVGVLQALAAAGAITLPNAIFIIFGQNIGTCITSILSSIGTTKTAKRTAIVHLIFNVFGTILFTIIALLFPFVELIQKLVPENTMMQIATSHTIFNIVGTLVMLPLSKLLIKTSYLVIHGEDPKKEEKAFMFLDNRILATPAVAVEQAFKEVERMGNLAQKNFDLAFNVLIKNDPRAVNEIKENEEVIDFLNHGITAYLIKINGLELDDIDRKSIGNLYHVINDIERIGDHSENICHLHLMLSSYKDKFIEKYIPEVLSIKKRVDDILGNAYEMFKNGYKQADTQVGVKVKVEEERIDSEVERLRDLHIEHLSENNNCTPPSSIAFMELLTNMERISDHANNIGFSMLSSKEARRINSQQQLVVEKGEIQ